MSWLSHAPYEVAKVREILPMVVFQRFGLYSKARIMLWISKSGPVPIAFFNAPVRAASPFVSPETRRLTGVARLHSRRGGTNKSRPNGANYDYQGWAKLDDRSGPGLMIELTVNHPERGDITLQTIVETMGGHDRNHLQQVEEIAG